MVFQTHPDSRQELVLIRGERGIKFRFVKNNDGNGSAWKSFLGWKNKQLGLGGALEGHGGALGGAQWH